jgi:PmbA protein
MLHRPELTAFARAAAQMLAREGDLAQFELYCSSAEHRIARLNYTSDIPCRGVEEFKSLGADGFQVRIALRRDAHETGTAFAAADLSLDALGAALGRARSAAVVDPHFPGFPREPRRLTAGKRERHDLLNVRDRAIASAGARILEGALAAFHRSDAAALAHPGLVIGGDISVIRDRIAIASSNFTDIRTDESAHFSASVTALVETLDGKGTAATLGGSAEKMRRAAALLGRAAVTRALALKEGARPPSGTYRVLFGPQPVAEILNYMVMASLTTGAFHAASSAYQGRFGDRVMDPRLSLADDPAYRAGALRRRITCEGIPARRVELIRDGRLVGLLSDYYDAHRLLTDEDRAEKLGPSAPAALEFPPLSGYRLGEGGGRRYDAGPGSAGTNVVMRARGGIPDREMIRAVGNGVYIGRVWYTYPINGQRAGDFTCTVSGDSYLIRNGELAEPLAPNALRVNANIAQVFDAVIAAGARPFPAVIWGAPEAYYVPAIAADGIALAEVGASL